MSACSEVFCQLDHWLTKLRPYWQFMPFACPDYPWRDSLPALAEWLDDLPEAEIARFLADPQALRQAVSPYLPEIDHLAQLSVLPELPARTRSQQLWPRNLEAGIPGRKWHQILAFHAAIPANGLPWLEWCAGKGYLGRVLAAADHQPVVSLEWQHSLCTDGQAIAKRLSLPMTFQQGDAFSPESASLVQPAQHAVALHACGDLHVTLLKQVAVRQAKAVSISPCCYHLIRSAQYEPLSEPAKASQLVLTKHDLRMPLQETVTAGQRVRKQRFVEVSFRLGFDALQQFLQHSHAYLPVPNVQKALLQEGFEAFCQWAAEKKGIQLPNGIDYRHWQQAGEHRFHRVERMELIRQVFRRPLELWLVYDRAMFMAQAGYQVSVGTFCDKPITPRNILIHAQLEK
ncbi:methyltransferase [Photobacterium sp. 1_MG-2023]|uniref:methyltransferase n=1 Tax=Photobacterium sp. 1_MG-2023 TaxID=3062646 RepID=UPI0026E2445C|nr:methyltransferase [Photobacterium sp. 1_MG-2023]MDO6706570.1 methyltransferase [Photobacterium sp. 1_MG-2023]